MNMGSNGSLSSANTIATAAAAVLNNNTNNSNSSNSAISPISSSNNNNNNASTLNNNLSDSTEALCVLASGEQPDADYIKMFVGQVPKSMDEDQLRQMFEEYGRVHSINVLRDKVTGVSKGKPTNLETTLIVYIWKVTRRFLLNKLKFIWHK